MNFGEKLRQLRHERNLTQPALAESLGIEQSYLSKLETGKSLPSNDVLNRILDVFRMDIGTLVDDLDQGTRNQLRQLSDVAEHFSRQKRLLIGNRRRWLLGSTLLLALGATSIYAGLTNLIVGNIMYTYESHGVVLEGESKELFLAISGDLNFQRALGIDEQELNSLRSRMDQRYLQTSRYRGDIFSVPVEGGSRTYRLRRSATIDAWQNKAVASVGVLLLVLGATGIFLEKKLSMYQ